MRPLQTTLTDWPAPVMMRRCEADPLTQLMRELDRLESCIDGLAELDEDLPPTERESRTWDVG